MLKRQHNKTPKHRISDLSPHLFWDVDIKNIRWDEDREFLIQRILEYGLDRDWILLKTIYGLPKIYRTARKLRSLDEIAMRFIATLSNVSVEKFRCYNSTQSLQNYSGY